MAPRFARTVTLVLVRHGETEGQSSIRFHGRTDVALSELGRMQIRAAQRELDRRFGARAFPHVFSSPLVRARESARLIAGTSAPILTVDEFAEVDFGLFEGLTAEEIRERHPAEFERWRAEHLAPGYAYPGGESRAAFAERVGRGLGRVLTLIEDRSNNSGRALIVAHRGVIRAVVRTLANAEPSVELGSIHLLEHDGPWHPRALDLTEHLESAIHPEPRRGA